MTLQEIKSLKEKSDTRESLIEYLIHLHKVKNIAEIGVFKGDLTSYLLNKVEAIENYTLIDPWRYLEDWNKPNNQSNTNFEAIYKDTLEKVSFAQSKLTILRGKTNEISESIEPNSLDAIYIDGDHTLKGITIDLIQMWDKLTSNGIIIGDDFYPSIKRNKFAFEPTLVFPFAVYFAEAKNVKIFTLPFNQFLIIKNHQPFEFIDLTGKYSKIELKPLIEEVLQTQVNENRLLVKFKRKLNRLLK
tara:strand:- start:91 stop:825 length:735 start_codon:yes stop_codon:yes gene_type:complete